MSDIDEQGKRQDKIMNDTIRTYRIDESEISPQIAYDLVRKAVSDLAPRKIGVYLEGDKDCISLLYHAAKHFDLKILGMDMNHKKQPVTRKIRARKVKEWDAFIRERQIGNLHSLFNINIDIHKTGKPGQEKSVSKAMQKLDQLIGLNEVKTQIHDIGHLMKNRKDRERAGLPAIAMSQHLVFTGNPGTGKTTVARLVGEIFREMGVLNKGHFVEIDGRGLIGEYVGQTAPKAKEIISGALDGVLFIDEAYALVQGEGKNDFGHEAVATLIKMMEDHRDRLVVIIAGYEDEMGKLLNANPGLKSRFKTRINFPDYGAGELYRIFIQLCNDNAYRLTQDVQQKAKSLFMEMHKNKGVQFGNGRAVRNAFDRCILNQARRLASKRKSTREELQIINASDIPTFASIEW